MTTNQEIQISCRKCGRKVASKSMKFDMNGKDLVCPDCYNKQHAKLPASATLKSPASVRHELSSVKKVKYYCTACNFRFSRGEGLQIETCPNCSKTTVFLVSSDKISDIMEDKFLKKQVYDEP